MNSLGKLRFSFVIAVLGCGLVLMAPIWGVDLDADHLFEMSSAIVIAEIPPPPPVENYDPTNGVSQTVYWEREVLIRRNLKGKFRPGTKLKVGIDWRSGHNVRTPAPVDKNSAAEQVIDRRYFETTSKHRPGREFGYFLLFLNPNPNKGDSFAWRVMNINGSVLEVSPSAVDAPSRGLSFKQEALDLLISHPPRALVATQPATNSTIGLRLP